MSQSPRVRHSLYWRFRNRHAMPMMKIDQETGIEPFGDPGDRMELTFYIELPRDLSLPANTPFVHTVEGQLDPDLAADIWTMVSRGRERLSARAPSGIPVGRTWLRRVYVLEGLPNFASDVAFDDEREMLTRSFGTRRAAERWYRRRPGVYKTVAACTLWLPPSEIHGEAPYAWLQAREALESCLGRLNDLIRAMAIKHQRLDLRPLSVGDLTSFVPYTLSRTEGITIECLATGLMYAHPAMPDYFDRTLEHEEAWGVFGLVATMMRQPARRPLVEMVADASMAFGRSEWRQSIIAMATAAETAIASITNHGAPKLVGKSVPFKSRIIDHLPKILGVSVDIHDTNDPVGFWWEHGYDIRNSVVHEGAWPTYAGAQFAITSLYRLLQHFSDRLRLRPESSWQDEGFLDVLDACVAHLALLCEDPNPSPVPAP